jgi:hypothetical protein
MLQLWFVSNTVLWPFGAKLGGMKLGLNVVVLMLAGVFWLGQSGKITLSSAKVLLAFLAHVIFSSIVALTGPCKDLQKLIITMPVLMFLVLLGLEVGRRASGSEWSNLQKTAQWCLIVAFSAFIVEMLMPAWFPDQAMYRSEGQLSGLFQEPSHVAFGLFPCIAVLLVAEDKRTRQKGMLALLGLLVFSRSSTLIALIAAWVIYRLFAQRKHYRQTALFALGIASLIAVGAAIDFDRFVTPTVERIVGVASPSEGVNMSSLVYVQGWQDAWFNLQRTHGMGLGLNMMGCGTLPDVSARSALTLGGFSDLNAEDGSFLFAKVVSEAGVGGIAFYIGVIWWWVQLEKKLRHLSEDVARFAAEAQVALIFCFVASSFIRSFNYFSGGLLLWVVAVSGTSKWRNLSTQPAGVHIFTSQGGQTAGKPSSGEKSSESSAAPSISGD